MFNLKNTIAIMGLFLSCIQAAHASGCHENDSLYPCGIEFTSIPTIPYLSTGSCNNNNLTLTYTIKNEGTANTAITYSLADLDLLADPTALSIDGSTSCPFNSTLNAGQSCDIVIDYQPCVAGDLDWSLTVTPQSAQRPVVLPIETVVHPVIAYVINSGFSPSISYCVFNSDGTFGSGSNPSNGCSLVTATFSVGSFNQPWDIIINADATYAYISNSGGGAGDTVSICPMLDPTTFGSLSQPCINTTGNGTFSGPLGMTLNKAGTLLYVMNQTSQTISICPVNSDGSLGTCDNSTNGGTQPTAIVLSEETGLAYVTDMTNPSGPQGSVRIFNIVGNTLVVNNSFTDPNLTLDEPTGIADGGDAVYIVNFGNSTLSFCPIDGTHLDACSTVPAADGLLATPTSLAGTGFGGYIANLHTVDSAYCITRCYGAGPICETLTDATFNSPSDVFVLH